MSRIFDLNPKRIASGILLFLVISCKTAPSTKGYYERAPAPTKNLTPASVDPCPEAKVECHPRRFVVADDGLQKVSYVNLDDPTKDWDIPVGARVWDIRLGGNGKILVPTTDGIGGYYEIDVEQGKITQAHTQLGFVRSVFRLKDGNTLVAGENLAGQQGTVLIEVGADLKVIDAKTKKFPKVKNSRLIRRTANGTYLLGSTVDNQSEHVLLEIDDQGFELQQFVVGTGPAHMGLRLRNGDTAVTSGRDLKLLIFDKDGKTKQTILMQNQSDKQAIDPYQAGYFQILSNGHFVMANWQGKNATSGRKGRQLVEYNAQGEQVWTWKQDPKRFSSISAFLVLDGLDLNRVHDDVNGPLEPLE